MAARQAPPLPVWEPRTEGHDRLHLYRLVYAERFGRTPRRLTEYRSHRHARRTR